MGILSMKVPSAASTLENIFCPAMGTVLFATAACKLAGIVRGTPLGGTWAGDGEAYTCAASKSGGGGGTMEDISLWYSASRATARSPLGPVCANSGISSGVEEGTPAMGGK